MITSQNGAAEPILLRPVDLIALLQISRSQVYLMLASGVIPSLKIGRVRRVRRSDLEKWINQTQGAA